MKNWLNGWIKRNNWWNFPLYSILVTIVTLVSYKNLNGIFYASDEWIKQGVIYNYGVWTGLQNIPLTEILAGRNRPLTSFLTSIFMYYFSYNVAPFVITAYIFAIINGLLLYLYVYKISKSQVVSFISGIFFVTVHAGYQSMTWMVNITQDPIAVTFILISQLLLIHYIETRKSKYLFLTALASYITFLFKDAFFYMFIWLPALYFLYTGKRVVLKQIIAKYWFLLIGLSVIVGYKLTVLYGSGSGIFTLSSIAFAYWYKVIFNWFYYSYITLSQTFIPQEYMFKIARNFTSFNYGYLITYIKNIDVISQNIVADLLSSIFSTIFLILLSVSYILNKSQRKIIVIGGVFYILSFSTIAAYLFERNTSYIESRYLYAGMISMGIFFAVITDTIKNILLKTRIPKFFSILCLVLSLVVFFYKQIILVQREVYRAVIMAENTKNVLSEFSRVFPILPDKPVIYLTGSDFYYSYLNHYVPLELNPGYIFMIWTYKSGKIPKELLPKELLRGYILSSFGIQWYEEYGGKAFGYYWDKDKLRSKIAEKNLSKSQLVGLYYDGHTNTFKDITNDLRKELFNN